jgi:hypothetical protein
LPFVALNAHDDGSRADGARFKTAFNEQVAEFHGVAERLSRLVEDFTQVRTLRRARGAGRGGGV